MKPVSSLCEADDKLYQDVARAVVECKVRRLNGDSDVTQNGNKEKQQEQQHEQQQHDQQHSPAHSSLLRCCEARWRPGPGEGAFKGALKGRAEIWKGTSAMPVSVSHNNSEWV